MAQVLAERFFHCAGSLRHDQTEQLSTFCAIAFGMLVGGFRDRSINNLTQASPCTAWPRSHDESKGLIPHCSCGLAAREALTSLKSVTYSKRKIGRASCRERV